MNRSKAKELKYSRSKQSESIHFDRLDPFIDEIFDSIDKQIKNKQSFGIRCSREAMTIQETSYWSGYADACGELLENKGK